VVPSRVSADSRNNFEIVAGDEVEFAGSVAANELEHIFGIDAAVLPAARVAAYGGRLPGRAGVICKFVALNPDCSVGEEIYSAHVVPVRVADDDVGDGRGCDADCFQAFIGREKIRHAEFLDPVLAMHAGVEEDRASAATDEPEDHGDVERLIFGSAHDESIERELRDGGVADGVD
jgi:hypothetical protein